jgi:formylglycine-generating enzyme required for sulfatase activity
MSTTPTPPQKTASPFAARTGTRGPFPDKTGPSPAKPARPATASRTGGAAALVAAVALLAICGSGVWWWRANREAPANSAPAATDAAAQPPAATAPTEAPEARAARLAAEFDLLQQRAARLALSDADRAGLAEATLLAAQAQARLAADEAAPAADAWARAVAVAGPLVLAAVAAQHDAEAAPLAGLNAADHASPAPRALAAALDAAQAAERRGEWSEALRRQDEARALIVPARLEAAAKFASVAEAAARRGDLPMATLFHERALRLDASLEPSRAHLYRHKFQPGHRLRSPGGIELAYAPPAEFTRGSASAEPGRDPDEIAHTVRLTRGFFIAVRETTQAEWDRVFGAGAAARLIAAAPGRSRAIAPELPMHSVTWEQAADYCRRLSQLEGLKFRLPTEAEWEHACRAGTTSAFNLGVDGLSARDANIDDGSTAAALAPRAPGTSGRANLWGLHDMHGNVWEWCADWSAPYPAAPGAPLIDPTGPAREELGRIDLAMKVVRGGGWNAPANDARSANRWEYAPAVATAYIGFRVAHDPELVTP